MSTVHPKPMSPVVDGRVVGSTWHGCRPLKVASDKSRSGFGVYVICRSCRAMIATRQPDLATARDLGCKHLFDVDHSLEAVKAGAR